MTRASVFDHLAPEYDRAFSERIPARWLRQRVRREISRYVAPESRVLDVGCGTGDDAVWFASQGHTVVATDVSAGMLELTRSKCGAAPPEIGARIAVVDLDVAGGDAGAASGRGPFDLVHSNFGALNCVANLQPFFAGLAGNDRPGGVFALTMMGRFCMWETAGFALRGDFRRASRRSFTEIKRHGDFGIATFDSLDGEMVAVDGEFYQVKADVSVVPVTDAMTSPFGTVTFFSPDISFILPTASNFSEFSVLPSSLLPSRNLFYAVRIRGEIPYVKARSIPHQEKPYPRLMEAAANQSVFEFNNTTGIVVGFYTPSMAEGLNVPGYHLHYISADRTKGGHILDFRLENATVELDTIPRFIMDLPPQGSFLSVDLSENLSNELAVVEQGSR